MSTDPQANILPQYIDPRKLAAKEAVLQGRILAESLTRLAKAVLEITAPVAVRVEFGNNAKGRYFVAGSATAQVELQCQRCLKPALVPLAANLSLTLVWSDDEAKALARDEEPWLVPAAEADLWDLIEEELILTLPIVSLHGEGCEITTEYGVDATSSDNCEVRPNPFEILAKLKQ